MTPNEFSYSAIMSLIERVAAAHPLIEQVLINRYRINDDEDTRYPIVAVTPDTVTVAANTRTSNISVLVADRLTADRSNEVAIQSSAIDVLAEISNAVSRIGGGLAMAPLTATPFTGQFGDNLAGAWATFSIVSRAPIGRCDWIENIEPGCDVAI